MIETNSQILNGSEESNAQAMPEVGEPGAIESPTYVRHNRICENHWLATCVCTVNDPNIYCQNMLGTLDQEASPLMKLNIGANQASMYS